MTPDPEDASAASKALFAAGLGAVAVGRFVARRNSGQNPTPNDHPEPPLEVEARAE